MLSNGEKPGAIARRLGVSRTAALRWRDRWEAGRSMAASAGNGGRPRKVAMSRIRELIDAMHIETAKQLRLGIAIDANVTYNLTYCRRLLRCLR